MTSPSSLRVLLVEDSDTQASLVASFLELDGDAPGVHVAARVVELAGALAQLQRPARFDVVLLDLTLPDSHGVSTLEAVVAATSLPVVVMTASDDRSGTGMMEFGASDFVRKDAVSLVGLPRTLRYAVVRHELSRELAAALEARDAADEGLRTFVSMASHELRAPISATRSLSGLLDSRWESLGEEQRRELVGRLHRRLGQVESVATLYLNAAAGEEQIHAATRVHDLGRVLAEAVETCVPGPDRADLSRGGTVLCDAGHVAAIVVNLVSNATKYGQAPVVVRADGPVVVVEDRGPGLDDPRGLFRAWDRNSLEGVSSTGLGLALSHQLARANDAELRYERVEETTRFVLTLPSVPSGAAHSSPSASSTRSPA